MHRLPSQIRPGDPNSGSAGYLHLAVLTRLSLLKNEPGHMLQ